jgi:uncharacterized membrane protein YjfL (UPF0719 family)
MMNTEHLIKGLVQSLLFSGVGLGVFVAGFFVIRLVLPYDVHKEIETDHNTALAVVIGSFILGLAIIIAAAIHGG